MRYALILTLSSVLTATSAYAANLSDVSGEVLVNAGEGFAVVNAEEPVVLKPGDKILVREKSFATISFTKCAVALSKPTLFTVTKEEPCATSASLPEQSFVVNPAATTDEELASEAAFVKTLVTGAMIVGAGAVLIDGLSNEDDPASGN